MGSAQEFFEDTVIETAVVIDVNMQKWTVDVATQYSEKNLYSVPWSLPYLHPENGEGILFVPEIGTQWLLCTPSDGEEAPFIIGFLPIPIGDSYRSNRIDMNPGDMGIMGRDGNYALLRRGGVVQIGSTNVAQRMYIPVANTIRDFAQNYSLTTFGGELVWEVDEDQETAGQTPTRYILRAKDFAERASGGSEYFPIVLNIGDTPTNADKTKRSGENNLASSQLDGTGKPLFELSVKVPNQTEFNIAIDGDGNVFAKAGAVEWDLERDLIYTVRGNRKVLVEGDDHLTVFGDRVEEMQSHSVKYTTSLEKGQSKKIDAEQVALGQLSQPQYPAVIGGIEFENALRNAFIVTVPTDKGPIVVNVTAGPGFSAVQNLSSKTVKITK